MVEAVPGCEGGDVIKPTQDCRRLEVLLVVGKVGCEGLHGPLKDAADKIAVCIWRLKLEFVSLGAEVHLLKDGPNASDEDVDDVGGQIPKLLEVPWQR